MENDEIITLVDQAAILLTINELHLLINDLSEQSITHWLARYLQKAVTGKIREIFLG